jgi:hypothetical protein
MWEKQMARCRNPLRRTSDRIEALLTFLLVMTMLLVGPWAGWSAARATYGHDVRVSTWEWKHRFAVAAVLLQNAAAPISTEDAWMRATPPTRTAARWTGPDGLVHTGTVVADVGARAGSTVPIWVDDHGTVATPPGLRSPTVDAVMAALLVMLGLAAGLAGIRRIVVWRLDRRRLRSWQAEWLVVGPRWSHR